MAGVNWRTTSKLAAGWNVSDCRKTGNTVVILTQDGVEMKPNTDLVAVEVLIVVTFTRRSVVRSIVRSAEDTGDVQIHQSSKSESEQGSSKDEPWSR